MYTNCDEVFKLTIPAVRVAVAKALKKKYNMNQSQIAKTMGVTQAAASKYLNSRYSAKIIRLERLIAAKKLDVKIASEIKKRKIDASERFDEIASSSYLVQNAMKLL